MGTRRNFSAEFFKAKVALVANVFIEGLWHSLKYECVYLNDFQDGPEAREEIGKWISCYNEERPHSSHADERTPMEQYHAGSLIDLMVSTLTPLPNCPKEWGPPL